MGTTMIYGYICIQERLRQRHFRDREQLSPCEWFGRLLPEAERFKAELVPVLETLQAEIGVDWTLFRPSDRFDHEFRCPHLLPFLIDDIDDLLQFENYLDDWEQKHAAAGMVTNSPLTLGELLRNVIAVLEREQRLRVAQAQP
jgi:hypothetical protein